MCKAAPADQDRLLNWIQHHGRFIPNTCQRHYAYGKLALVAIDAYLGDTCNKHAPTVRAAVATWVVRPTPQNRVLVRRARRRLYDAQHRDGSWLAHRGVIDAAKITSPYPHNVDGVLRCVTWDSETRSQFYSQLWDVRREYDAARTAEAGAFCADDGDGVREHSSAAQALLSDLDRLIITEQPVLSDKHMPLANGMLAAYEQAVAGLPSAALPDLTTKRP